MKILRWRFDLTAVVFISFSMFACTTYDVDTSRKPTLAGSLNKAVSEKESRSQAEQNQNSAPVYIDYSKRNPVLRHDDEFDEDAEYDQEDPFEQEVEFYDYERMKKRQQAKRNMEQNHDYKDKDEQPISIW